MKRIFLIVLAIYGLAFSSLAQEEKKKNNFFKNFKLDGYVKNMQTIWYQEVDRPWLTDNLIHNRLNFKWYASKNFTTVVEGRNRFMWGKIVETVPGYEEMLSEDKGYFDLSETIASDTSYIFHSMIDRAYFDLYMGKFQARVGRQRINWGRNLVWNPNDIFNTFSYFDFDYEERPGTDAVKLEYYPNYTSSAEVVYQVGENADETALAGMYNFNKWSYDFQFLGGYMKTDLVAGLGWAGQIEGGGFRGEATYFHPKDNPADTSGQLVASISGDYTCENSIYLHSAVLYNSEGTTGKAGGRNLIMDADLTAKTLTLAKYSLFGQVSYPFSPLINGGISGIYNPSDNSYYVSPQVTISLSQNLEWMALAQLFGGNTGTEFGDYGKLFFGRFRYSF